MTKYKQKPNHNIKHSELNNKIVVILVEPKNNLNIGAVARVMDNFGWSELRLVAPRDFSPEQALFTACWADGVVNNIQVYDNLDRALSDLKDVVGFSSAYGRNRVSHKMLADWSSELNVCALPKTGLVFGSEDNGLSNEHVVKLRTLLRIPSNADNPSLNLAQSVAIVLYELSRHNWPINKADQQAQELNNQAPSDLVDWQQYEVLEKKLDNIMEISGFKSDHSSADAPRVLFNLLRRLQLDKREQALVMALTAKVEKALNK